LKRRESIDPIAQQGPRCDGFARCALVDGDAGSVHMGLGYCRLEDGHVDEHVQSCEESFYVLEGEPVLYLDGRGYRLARGACGVVPVGVPHAWRAEGEARWIDMFAPQPRRPDEKPDTFFVGPPPSRAAIVPVDVRDPRTRNFFRLEDWQLDVDNLKVGAPVEQPTVSASMATALLAYSGITVKMLVDKRLDAHLHTMFMVQYRGEGVALPHDHPFEESYYMLEGEIEVVADGERYTLFPGDAFWTGVGCVHAFYNTSGKRVTWLETSAPGPPDRHSYRFDRDWDYLDDRIESSQELKTSSS
jgi:mannose-6-phosphate isomerase-like protein (cupin superfamily)